MTITDKEKTLKQVIKMVKKDYGNIKCDDYSPYCTGCWSQMLIGLLQDYIDDIDWGKV